MSRAYWPIDRRFMQFVLPVTESGCWIWMGSTLQNGYGRFWVKDKFQLAHRISWQLFRTAAVDDMFVCHHCDVPPCVNPNHLFLGTQLENMRDRNAKNRANWRRGASCPHSKLTEEQVTYIRHSTESPLKISKRFGVARTTVSNVRNGHKWKHTGTMLAQMAQLTLEQENTLEIPGQSLR